MQSNLDSSSLSGVISSDASSYPSRSNEPTWIADNVAEIAPDNSSLEMLAAADTSYERVARYILPLDLWKHVHAHRQA